jgi:hypothetical protein
MMGARYARAANGVEPDKLGLAPRRVLVAMSLRALDAERGGTPAGVYFAGRNRLLGDLAMMPTASSLRHLSRMVATLEQLGLVERIGSPAPGQRSVYKLLLPVDNLPP